MRTPCATCRHDVLHLVALRDLADHLSEHAERRAA